MNDLISRKALLMELKKYVESVYECDFDDPYCTADGGSLNPKFVQGLWEAKEIIEELPTAYDVEKVIEQLEDYGKYKGILRITDNPANYDNYVPVREVKKIVKGGGQG